jgi:antirestriction protein ArdC
MSITVYEIINKRILELLEQGTIPWRKPWKGESNMPRNLISKREYQGINLFLLNAMPYESPYWLTFKQVVVSGGHLRKGERATQIIFWKWLDRKDNDEQVGVNGKIPMLRYYNVFNLDQTEGITAPEPAQPVKEFNPIERAEEVIANMPMRPDIRYGGNRAYYSPVLDYVQIPNRNSFNTEEEFYSTCYHELSHATGHMSRLGRKSILEPSYFGSHEYSKEELIAEMGAAFLCGHTGIEQRTIENSAAYISGWLRVLKNDKTLLVHAASLAQKSSDYILNRKDGEQEHIEDMAA